MSHYICGDAYDDKNGVTYICLDELDHDGIIHNGLGLLAQPMSVISWSDDAPRRRALRAVSRG